MSDAPENLEPQISDEVREALYSEWTFQNCLNVSGCENKSTAELILLIEEYTMIMRNKWVFKKGDMAANEELRKIATMCLRAMHKEGSAIPRRNFPKVTFPDH